MRTILKNTNSVEKESNVVCIKADGRIVNADVNGAANILRKSSRNFDFEELNRGLLASPLRIKLA